jgi:hypothetical protein
MTTLNLQVNASGNDAMMAGITENSARAVTTIGICTIADSDIPLGSEGTNDERTGGYRFLAVTIPNGASITTATLTRTAYDTYSADPNVCRVYVSGEAADDATVFSTVAGNLNTTARPRSTAYAVWTITTQVADSEYTVDVTTIVQEIVNRAGWASGNALAILIDCHEDTNAGQSQRTWSYDGSTSKAMKLDIIYSTGGGGSGQIYATIASADITATIT